MTRCLQPGCGATLPCAHHRMLQARKSTQADRARADLEAPPGEAPALVEVPITAALPVHVPLRQVAAPLVSASVRKATEYTVEIIDAEKVPAFAPGGFELRPIDQAALKRYLKGLPEGKREIAGACRLVAVDWFARKG